MSNISLAILHYQRPGLKGDSWIFKTYPSLEEYILYFGYAPSKPYEYALHTKEPDPDKTRMLLLLARQGSIEPISARRTLDIKTSKES